MENVKQRLWGLILKKGSTPLPLDYLMITFTAELLNGIASTSVFSYLPKLVQLINGITRTSVFAYLPRLVQELGISEEKTGTYVGYIASSMTLSSSIFSFLIGYLTDHYNKKHVLFSGCVFGMIAAIALGFSYDIKLIFVVRFLQGAPCILIPSQSMLFERCNTSNKAVAMAFSLSAYSCGLIIGPVIGGFFSFPVLNISSSLKGTIFDLYPILLPNTIVGIGYASLVVGLLCFNHRPLNSYELIEQANKASQDTDSGPRDDAISSNEKIAEESPNIAANKDNKFKQTSKLGQALSDKNVCLTCLSYVLFTFIAIGFNEMYAVWASTTKKYHGLEFSTKDIGTSLLVAAIPLTLLQVIVLSNLFHCFSVKKLYLGALLTQSIFYILYPVLYLVHQQIALWIFLCSLILLTRVAVGASFTAVTVLLNNSVGNELIGTVNGLGMACGSISSALAPTIFGIMYTWSLSNVKGVSSNKNPLGFPFNQFFVFFIMSILCLFTSVAVYFVKDLSNKEK